jgi:hypothetical protein
MKQLYLILTSTLLLCATVLPSFAQVSNDNEDGVVKMNSNHSRYDYVKGQVLVKFSDKQTVKVNRSRGVVSTNVSQITKVLQKYGVGEMDQLLPQAKATFKARSAKAFNGETIKEHDLSQLYEVKLSAERAHETMQLVKDLQTLEEVEFAEPNYRLYALEDATIDGLSGGNPYATSQWYLEAYGVTSLWNKRIVNPARPVIAILDTGVEITHPDLTDNIWTNAGEVMGEKGYDNDNNGFNNDLHGWDFINNTPNIRDFNMHGTHVAGIAAASNNGIGIMGANPKALIMPVTVMQSDGSGDVATIIQGINYAVDNGATILNMSLGTYANSRALRQALENAYQKAVIVAAAGNDGKCINSPHHPTPCYGAAPMFPAAYSFVLGVQATTKTGALAGFSNYDDDGNTFSSVTTLQDPDGFNYELKAPGTEILSTIPGGKYKVLQGTSMAAPLVAGAISTLTMVKDYSKDDGIHQEILWGDLLHTNNIAEAYAVTNRPAELDLMKIMYRERKELSEETEEDYGGDGEIDAGETVSLYPVIRTTFGAASNIKMKLEIGDEYEDPDLITILTPDWVNFGLPLSAYGKGVSQNPLQLKVASNVADNRHIKMKFTAKCDETNTLYEGHFTIVVNNMVKINGLISEDRTLTADHVYLVNDNIGIMEGVTLTIEPGTRLEFQEGMGLSSFGKLVANGTPEKPIVFTGHNGAVWAGIKSHGPTGAHSHDAVLYTNDEQTLFTLLPTEATPNKFTEKYRYIYYGANDDNPNKAFYLSDYINYSDDFTTRQHLLTDPNYLTSAVLQMLSDWEAYCSQHPTQYSADNPNSTGVGAYFFSWNIYDNPRDIISYCRIEGYRTYNGESIYYPYMEDCVISPSSGSYYSGLFYYMDGIRNTLTNTDGSNYFYRARLSYSNIVNNWFGDEYGGYSAMCLPSYSNLCCNNYFNNSAMCTIEGKYNGKYYFLANSTNTPNINHSNTPSYLGSSREDIIRPYVYEIGNAPNTYGQIDLSNMPAKPYAEAHGIVWKVCVNGKDAQDEYEDLAPLGVGKHKFEVYFNRPMNKAVAPQISFGVRDPWSQNAVAEDGSWNEEGTIYTAYKTINGRTKSDGINRIYVRGAEDNEYFEIPYEKTRFNVMINAAGSMATGFAAEAGMGRVNLTWDNSHNDFEDAMGFNVYRYTEGNEENPTRLNEEIVDVEATSYTDYDVTPGTTYYYYYKVLSTDLKEYDISNVVVSTPLTASLGDANGDGDVDVMDVTSTVDYIVGNDPKPFVFDAADMNTDKTIDVLDVVGIVNKILSPNGVRMASSENAHEAVYTIENGMLYIETPVALAGLQLLLNVADGQVLTPASSLKGFEQASTRFSENDYQLLAYNIGGRQLEPGKHAILDMGDAEISSIRLSDRQGRLVRAVPGQDTTGIKDAMGSKVKNVKGIYNLNGQKITNSSKLQHGVYIINGQKVVK